MVIYVVLQTEQIEFLQLREHHNVLVEESRGYEGEFLEPEGQRGYHL